MNTLVLADDFSGAAEIAGIASRKTSVVLSRDATRSLDAECVVIDSDTRGLVASHAAGRVAMLLGAMRRDGVRVFKKVDSLLRGPVLAEIESAVATLGRDRVLLLSQNPSRARTIRHGTYLVDGVPLHETSLANDPTHPARTSEVLAILGPSRRPLLLRVQPPVEPAGITLAEASTLDEVRAWATSATTGTLAVGGADLFTAWFDAPELATKPLAPAARCLHVCGTMQRQSTPARRFPIADSGADWLDHAAKHLRVERFATVSIDRPAAASAADAMGFGEALCEAAVQVINAAAPDRVLVEGGATAARMLDRLGWRTFDVVAELAVGVVAIRPIGVDTILVVKPGSYPWPAAAWT